MKIVVHTPVAQIESCDLVDEAVEELLAHARRGFTSHIFFQTADEGQVYIPREVLLQSVIHFFPLPQTPSPS